MPRPTRAPLAALRLPRLGGRGVARTSAAPGCARVLAGLQAGPALSELAAPQESRAIRGCQGSPTKQLAVEMVLAKGFTHLEVAEDLSPDEHLLTRHNLKPSLLKEASSRHTGLCEKAHKPLRSRRTFNNSKKRGSNSAALIDRMNKYHV